MTLPAQFTAFPLGFGVFPLTGEARPDEDAAVAVIQAALDAGVRFVDTADSYHAAREGAGSGYGETLVARALREWGGDADAVLVGTKGGRILGSDGERVSRGDPAYLKSACEASLRRLGVESIGLYQYHRPDPAVDYADSLGAFAELYDEGKVQAVGISNASPAEIELASAVLGERLVSVQNQFGPGFLSSSPELESCAEKGLAFLPWSAFGGADPSVPLVEEFPVLGAVAEGHGVSWYRVVVAWMLAKPGLVLPIPGARRVPSIIDTLAGCELTLGEEELALLDAAFFGAAEGAGATAA